MSFYSIFRSPADQRIGALSAMRLLSERLPPGHGDNRQIFPNNWFAKDAPSALRVAALRYLADLGVESDLPVVAAELERNDTQTRNVAADAVIRINLRYGRERAIRALYDLQPASIGRGLLTALFHEGDALPSELLLTGITSKNAQVRRATVELLARRDALPPGTAEQLLADADAEVRLAAVRVLAKSGRTYSDDDAKRILIKPTASGIGLYAVAPTDTAGEACWERFRIDRLRSMTDAELEAESEDRDDVFDMPAHFVCMERHFARRGDELREAVTDQYRQKFAVKLARCSGWGETYEKVKSLEGFLRKKLTRSGLDIICRKANGRDLSLVRKVLREGFIDPSNDDIEYLRKHGEWADIDLIVELLGRPGGGFGGTLLSALPYGDTRDRLTARAVSALARGKLDEVLAKQLPSNLLTYVIVEVPEREFRELDDPRVVSLLRSDSDRVRKATAVKCVKVLQKARIAKLLADYTSGGEFRYYNVIHWLDMGVSVPRDRATAAASKVMREWQEQGHPAYYL